MDMYRLLVPGVDYWQEGDEYFREGSREWIKVDKEMVDSATSANISRLHKKTDSIVRRKSTTTHLVRAGDTIIYTCTEKISPRE